MFKKLLVPLDGSPLAEQALACAAFIASACRAKLELVLVQEPVGLEEVHDAVWKTERTSEAHRYLESIAADIAVQAGVSVSINVRHGEPVEWICKRAADGGADLIVLTSHGRTGFNRAWFGSVADGLVTHARIPVLMLRPVVGAARTTVDHVPFGHVLVALDGSAFAQEVLPAARALASCARARMTLMRVAPPVPDLAAAAGLAFAYVGTVVDAAATQRCVDDAKEQLATLARQLHDDTGLEVESLVVTEPPIAQSILDYSRARRADVIAISTHGGGVSRFLLGSVADKVLRGSEAAILVYRPAEVGANRVTRDTGAEKPRALVYK